MGLIKAAIGAIGGTLADQWKEYFVCDALPADTLMVKGQKQTSSRSSNKKGSDNIITNGSGIVVADGQCMIIVDKGKVAEICAEPGQFTYNASTEPSLFTGKFGTALKETFKTMGRRFTYGGDTGSDQRVYYFNTKEILDNKFGTANPVPFRIVDSSTGLDLDTAIRCFGVYSYRIADPVTFYTNLCGNVTESYTRDNLDSQLKTEFISALQPAFAKLSAKEMRPNQIVAHTADLEEAMNQVLTSKWKEKRGLEIASVAIGSLTIPEEDQETIKSFQKARVLRDPSTGAAMLVGAQAEAMKSAAKNESGAMTGFMGLGMANQAASGNIQNLYAMGASAKPTTTSATTWKCSCGAENTGKFCTECGAKKPENGWTCSCGAVNKGRFCSECGAKKPANAPLYKCDKCGWEPEDPANPPKFCPECGDIFNDKDIKN